MRPAVAAATGHLALLAAIQCGNFYGYLTANRSNPQRTRIKLYINLTDLWETITNDPESVADRLCGRT